MFWYKFFVLYLHRVFVSRQSEFAFFVRRFGWRTFCFWGMVLLLNAYTISFFGHRYIENPLSLQNILEKLIEKIIDENEYVDFLVGRNGDFDIIASSAVRRVRKNHRDDNSSLILTLPYNTAEYKNNKQYFEEYYNDVRISFSAELAHPKSAIEKRNFEMIDMSDLIIFYVTNTQGGAYKALKYAEKSGKNIIKIAKIDII